jgi:hypothetical protein
MDLLQEWTLFFTEKRVGNITGTIERNALSWNKYSFSHLFLLLASFAVAAFV